MSLFLSSNQATNLKNADQPVPEAIILCKSFLCAASLLFLPLLSSIWIAFLCWIMSRCFSSPLDLAEHLVKGHLQANVIFFCFAEVGFLEESRWKSLQVAGFGMRFRCKNQYIHLKKIYFCSSLLEPPAYFWGCMISFLCMYEMLAPIFSCIFIYTYATNKSRFEGKHSNITSGFKLRF